MNEWNGVVESLRRFSEERNWDQFHAPKNLAIALLVETSELLENFQWLTEEQSRVLSDDKLESVGEEIADVQIYLIQLADKLGIDILQAVTRKIEKNAERYPRDKAFGRSDKQPRKTGGGS